MSKEMTEEDLANMSDDDLMGMAIPPSAPAPEPEAAAPAEPDPAPAAEPEETEDPAEPEQNADDPDPNDDPSGSNAEDDPDPESDGSEVLGEPDEGKPEPTPAADPVAEPTDASKKGAKKGEEGQDPEAGETPDAGKADAKAGTGDGAEKAVDYKAAYEKIMGGFKANGKEVKLENIDEAVQLMQMGANYTKKLQALQPNLKLLRMLQNNGLLDETKLTYLIDIDKKDPAALQKLIRESGIDPMEIDTSVEPDYKAGNYSVSDTEMNFSQTLEEVASTDTGKELIGEIHRGWDAASKEQLANEPQILRVLTTQRENGIYAQISAEVERRRVLGQLGNQPFIHAYNEVGKEMHQQGKLTPKSTATPQTQQNPAPQPQVQQQPEAQPSRVVETRPAQRKTDPEADARARAASPTKGSPAKAKSPDVNPLSMSDEDFEKSAALAQRL